MIVNANAIVNVIANVIASATHVVIVVIVIVKHVIVIAIVIATATGAEMMLGIVIANGAEIIRIIVFAI